jgi:type II secretory pathway pseudopilin PulG
MSSRRARARRLGPDGPVGERAGKARRPRLRVADAVGFTLVEMVVTVAAGTMIALAIITVLDLSMRQSARTLDRVEASQHGRTAMEELVQELHSSCVAASVTPVIAGSTSSTIEFLSQFGSGPVLTPNMHVVTLAGGKLTDLTYPATSGTAPTWTFSATPSSTKLLGANLWPALVGGVSQPVFQYYAYVNGQVSSTPLATPLSGSDAADTVQVTVSFAAGPSDLSTEADRKVSLSDSVVLRFIPASGTQTVVNLPCN